FSHAGAGADRVVGDGGVAAAVADAAGERRAPHFGLGDLLQRGAGTGDVRAVAVHRRRGGTSAEGAEPEGGESRAGSERGAGAGLSGGLPSETKHCISLDRSSRFRVVRVWPRSSLARLPYL